MLPAVVETYNRSLDVCTCTLIVSRVAGNGIAQKIVSHTQIFWQHIISTNITVAKYKKCHDYPMHVSIEIDNNSHKAAAYHTITDKHQ